MMKNFQNIVDKQVISEYNIIKNKMKSDSKMKFALMIENFGPFKKNKSYQIRDEGYDWIRVKLQGSQYYIPTNFINPDPFSYLLKIEEEYKEQEDYYDADWTLNEDFIFQY